MSYFYKGFDYFKSGRSQKWIWRVILFGSQNNNAVSCYKEAVQFSAFFVMSVFASFWSGNGSPMATNVVVFLAVLAVITFSIP